MHISYKEHIIVTPDNYLLTSPNCSHFTGEIPPLDNEIGRFATPQQLRQINWSDNKRPYLPYMLYQNTFTSPLLSRLNYKFWNLPLEVTTGWRLAPEITESWKRLEDILRLTYQLLFQHSNHIFPLELMEPRLPSTYDLYQFQTSEKYARKRAIRARDAFLPLLAYCTYAISLYTRASHYIIQDAWYNVLIQERMHPPTVDAIRASEIATFSLRRAGVIVHAPSCLYTGDLHRMVKARVPVLIFWGTVFHPIHRTGNILNSHIPSREEIRESYLRRFANVSPQWLLIEDNTWNALPPSLPPVTQFPSLRSSHAIARPHRPQQVIPDTYPSNDWEEPSTMDVLEPMDTLVSSSQIERTPLAPVLDLPRLPKPERASGQCQGETWQEFMIRHQEARQKLLDWETPQQKQRRESHLQLSARGPVRSSNVFVWQKDEDTGFRIRSRIPKQSAYVVWEDYPSAHRRYDEVYNEWDLCSDFGEGRPLSPEQDSDDDEAPFTYVASPYVPTLREERHRRQVIADLANTLEVDANDIHPESESDLPFPPMFLEHVLKMRYGFLEDLSQDVTQKLVLENQQISDMDWHNLSKMYAERPLINTASPRFRSIVKYFTNAALSLFFDNQSFPSEYIWDLRSSHRDSVHLKILSSSFGIEPLIVDNKTMYEIKTNSSTAHLEVNWHLVLEDSLTALQCIRSGWGPGLKDIAIGLASIGATFHMLQAFSIPPCPILGALDAPLLGYRPHGYKPTAADYTAYLEIRNDVLLQEPRCRAAIARGGILWRLAIESLLPALVIDRNVEIDFSQHGSTRSYLTQNGEYWEDALTEADEMAICGVYHVYTGNRSQTAHQSWWPKPSVWGLRGLNVGYWSAGCEHWYQERLKMIREGKAELRSATEWWQSLTFQIKSTRKIVAAHEKAADRLLHGQYL